MLRQFVRTNPAVLLGCDLRRFEVCALTFARLNNVTAGGLIDCSPLGYLPPEEFKQLPRATLNRKWIMSIEIDLRRSVRCLASSPNLVNVRRWELGLP